MINPEAMNASRRYFAGSPNRVIQDGTLKHNFREKRSPSELKLCVTNRAHYFRRRSLPHHTARQYNVQTAWVIRDGTLKHNFREKTFSLGTHAVRHESHASLLEGVPYHITKRGNGRQRAFFEECLPHRHCQRTPHGTPRSPAWLSPFSSHGPTPFSFLHRISHLAGKARIRA